VSALTLGTAANAIWLQYTAPMWMYLASVWWLGEPADRRSSGALAFGLCGVAVIVWGGWQEEQLAVVAIALGSGLAYAGVMVCLRLLRDLSPRWLTVLNHLCAALVLVPFVWHSAVPTRPQLGVLLLYGAVQMAIPYWLVARGLRAVSPQEAGIITLLEPLLNPIWAYFVSPQTETPSPYTLAGGTLILGALAWRYWPWQKRSVPPLAA
jgi:drug/metabolite transporter (DMT)-like permease